MGRRQRVLILVHPRFRPDRRSRGGTTEKSIFDALKKLGHTVGIAAAEDDFEQFTTELKAFKPNIVFNLLEEFRGEGVFDFHLASYLESLGISFTGCNPRGLAISRNKFLVMKAVEGLGWDVPATALGSVRGVQKCPESLEFPLFVKLNREHASLGIRPANRVTTERQLASVCARLRRDYGAGILIQEFVPGNDVSVSVWGNEKVETFSPWQLEMSGPDGFATEHLKFNPGYRRKHGIDSKLYAGQLKSRLRRASAEIFSALDLSGYARMDFRVTPDDRFYLVDVNANPSLSPTEDFADSLAHEGYSYTEIIERILRLAADYEPKR